MVSFSAGHGNDGKSWLGKALGGDGDGHWAVMEHEAGLGSGRRWGSGFKFGLGY